jgi:hypothetical protein
MKEVQMSASDIMRIRSYQLGDQVKKPIWEIDGEYSLK